MEHIYSIEEIRSAVLPIAQKYGAERIALFGSYARGEATSGSDIDLHIIDNGDLRGLFKLAGFQRELEEALSISVDVLTTDALSGGFLDRIKREEVLLYE